MSTDSVTIAPTRADVARYEADVEHLAECIYRRENEDLGLAWESTFPSTQDRVRAQARSMLAVLRSAGFTVERRASATEVAAQVPGPRDSVPYPSGQDGR